MTAAFAALLCFTAKCSWDRLVKGLVGGGCVRGLVRIRWGWLRGCVGTLGPQAKGHSDFQKVMHFTRFSLNLRDAPEALRQSKSD